MKENEPENYKKIAKIMLPKDYIAYKMTGVHSCDYSDASGMLLLDVKNKCWSKEMMEICDVKEEQLPKLFESYEVTGSLTEEAAAALGLTTNCKIAANILGFSLRRKCCITTSIFIHRIYCIRTAF